MVMLYPERPSYGSHVGSVVTDSHTIYMPMLPRISGNKAGWADTNKLHIERSIDECLSYPV